MMSTEKTMDSNSADETSQHVSDVADSTDNTSPPLFFNQRSEPTNDSQSLFQPSSSSCTMTSQSLVTNVSRRSHHFLDDQPVLVKVYSPNPNRRRVLQMARSRISFYSDDNGFDSSSSWLDPGQAKSTRPFSEKPLRRLRTGVLPEYNPKRVRSESSS